MIIVLFNCADPSDQTIVSQTVFQQPVSASVQLGDPVALQCFVTSQRTDYSYWCTRKPRVYWFRSGSGPANPADSYLNANRCGECSSVSASQSCLYTLPKHKVDSSDAGTYYCTLVACGEVVFGSGTKLDVFGNGTKLDVDGNGTNKTGQYINIYILPTSSPMVYFIRIHSLFIILVIYLPGYG